MRGRRCGLVLWVGLGGGVLWQDRPNRKMLQVRFGNHYEMSGLSERLRDCTYCSRKLRFRPLCLIPSHPFNPTRWITVDVRMRQDIILDTIDNVLY